jgi:hypothetical protein
MKRLSAIILPLLTTIWSPLVQAGFADRKGTSVLTGVMVQMTGRRSRSR